MKVLKTVVLAASVAALWVASAGRLDAQTVTKANKVTATATIQQLDVASRTVTVRNEQGEEDTFVVGPEVTRFNQLKVGDRVSLTYYESLVLQLRKPGEPSNLTADAAVAGRVKEQPGAGIATLQTRTVTVKAVDLAAPSITVTTQDGYTMTRKVEDRKNVEGVKAGDRIDITYSQAMVLAAEPAK
jgi:Cu/Ag efflux protein CusF